MRAFCNLELGRDPIPDETTILNFRHLLETHGLTKAVFEAVADHLEARGALLRGGTIVDATLIAASPSTKNAAGKRDPEMRSSKKGNQWHFGMKAHIGVDPVSGIYAVAVHSRTGHTPPMLVHSAMLVPFKLGEATERRPPMGGSNANPWSGVSGA
jgi:IS5 family transposase